MCDKTAEIQPLKLDQGTVNIWPNGSLVFAGYKTMELMEEDSDKLMKILKNFGHFPTKLEYTICSVTAVLNLNCDFDLPTLYNHLRTFTTVIYLPEIFPSLSLKYQMGTLSIFTTGKIIMTGTKSVDVCYNMASDIFDCGIMNIFK